MRFRTLIVECCSEKALSKVDGRVRAEERVKVARCLSNKTTEKEIQKGQEGGKWLWELFWV